MSFPFSLENNDQFRYLMKVPHKMMRIQNEEVCGKNVRVVKHIKGIMKWRMMDGKGMPSSSDIGEKNVDNSLTFQAKLQFIY